MQMRTKFVPALVAVLLALAAGGVTAVDEPAPAVSSDHAAGRKAIEARDWNGAIKSLSSAAQRDARNADMHFTALQICGFDVVAWKRALDIHCRYSSENGVT